MNKSVGWGLLFGLLGVLPAFFLVFATLFSDGGAASEYLVSIGLIAVVYGLLGAWAGYVLGRWQAGLWVSSAAVALVVWYTAREQAYYLLHAVVLLAAVLGACLGAGGGAALKARRRVR